MAKLRILLLVLASCLAAWSAELANERPFRDYAKELQKRGVEPLSEGWDGGVSELGLITVLARGSIEQWTAYVGIGIKAAQTYPAKDYRFAQYWKTLIVALAAPSTNGGREALNAMLMRKDLPFRVTGWALQALMEQRTYGASLSWIDQEVVFRWCEEALSAPAVFIERLHGAVAEPLPAQLAPGPNRPRMRSFALDIDSRRLAAWAIEEIVGVSCAVPRDPAMLGLPTQEQAWNVSIERAIAQMPLIRAHVELRRSAVMLIDGRTQASMGKEQTKSLVQCYMLGQRADAASFAAHLLWVSRLIEAGDPAGLIAADEILRFVHLTAKSGGYLHRSPFVEAGVTAQTPVDRLSRLDPPPAASRGIAALLAWAGTVVEIHERAASSVPGPIAMGEWNRAGLEVGCKLPVAP
jgi:hypothetical protein